MSVAISPCTCKESELPPAERAVLKEIEESGQNQERK